MTVHRRRPAHRLALTASCVVALLGPAVLRAAEPGASPQPQVAFASEVGGDWLVSHGGGEPQPLKRGMKLLAGDLVRPSAAPGASDRITLVYLDERRPLVCTCSKDRCPCDAHTASAWPMRIEGAGAPPPLAARLWPAIERFLTKPAGTYIAVISRAGVEPDDGVVLDAQGTLDLRSVLRRMPAGEYRVKIELLASGGAAAAGVSIPSTSLTWRPGGPATLTVDGLRPGLFRLILRRQSDSGAERVDEAWILVSDAADYETASTAYADAARMMELWRGTLEPATIPGMLRSWLEELAHGLRARP